MTIPYNHKPWGKCMAITTIQTDVDDMVTKIPCKGSKGAYGVVYVPKAWIGQKVYVVLRKDASKEE